MPVPGSRSPPASSPWCSRAALRRSLGPVAYDAFFQTFLQCFFDVPDARYLASFSAFTEPLPNAVYAVHDYALPGIAGTGVYPGHTRGQWFDRDAVEKKFLERTAFMRRTGTPIWVGEFGVIR